MSRKYFIVWNEDKNEGFVTDEYQIAYEVRKAAESNCYYEDGSPSPLAMSFCQIHGDGNCTIEEFIEL